MKIPTRSWDLCFGAVNQRRPPPYKLRSNAELTPVPGSQTHVRLSLCTEKIWKAFLIRVWGYWLKCSRAVYQPFFSFFIILIKLRYYLIPTCIDLVLLECKPDKEYSWSPLSCHKDLLKRGWLSPRSSRSPSKIITFLSNEKHNIFSVNRFFLFFTLWNFYFTTLLTKL